MDVIIPDDLFPYFEIYGTRKNYAPGEMSGRRRRTMNAFIWWNPAASESIAPTLPEGSSLFGSWARAG